MGAVRGILAGAVLLAGVAAGMRVQLGELLPINFPTPRAERTITMGRLVDLNDQKISTAMQVARLEWIAEADDVIARECQSHV